MKNLPQAKAYREFVEQIQNKNPKPAAKSSKIIEFRCNKTQKSQRGVLKVSDCHNQSHNQSQATVVNHYPYHKYVQYQNQCSSQNSHNQSCKTERNFVKIKISTGNVNGTEIKRKQQIDKDKVSLMSHRQMPQHQSYASKSQKNIGIGHRLNSKTNMNVMYSYNKYISEITQILSKTVQLKEGEDLLEHKISYIEYLQSLKALKMIHNSYQPYPRDLVGSLWTESISQNTTGNFIVAVGTILKYTGDEDSFRTNPVDYYLAKKYQDMRMVRLQLNGSTHFSPHNEDQTMNQNPQGKTCTFTFKPTINKRSQQLAANRSITRQVSRQVSRQISRDKDKKKICTTQKIVSGGKAHNVYSFNSDFLKKNIRYKTDLSAEKQNCLEQFEYEDHLLDTLNPINGHYLEGPYKMHTLPTLECQPRSRQKDQKGNIRSEKLYQLAKSKSLQKRHNAKSKNDIDYEKNIKELTFKPNVSFKKFNTSVEKVKRKKIKGEDLTVNRMIKGRVEKQVRKIMKDKGIPYNQKIANKFRKEKFIGLSQKLKQDESNILENTFNLTQSYQNLTHRVNKSPNISRQYYENQAHSTPKKIPEFQYRDYKDLSSQNSDSNPNSNTHSPKTQNQFSPLDKDAIVVSIFIEQDRSEQLVYNRKQQSLKEAAQRFAKQHHLSSKDLEKLIRQLYNVVKKDELSCIKEESDESIQLQNKEF